MSDDLRPTNFAMENGDNTTKNITTAEKQENSEHNNESKSPCENKLPDAVTVQEQVPDALSLTNGSFVNFEDQLKDVDKLKESLDLVCGLLDVDQCLTILKDLHDRLTPLPELHSEVRDN